MKLRAAFVFLLPAILSAQLIAVRAGPSIVFEAPAVDGSGHTVLLGASIDPNGAVNATVDLYAAAQDGSGLRRLTDYGVANPTAQQGIAEVSLAKTGTQAAVVAILPSRVGADMGQLHLIDTAAGTDRAISVDAQGCVLPLGPSIGFFSCIHSPHFTPDGKKILFSVNRNQPFMIVNSDGTGLTRLSVYTGALAPGPQRVISSNGLIVFTSSAPSGPALAASATDVYVAGLDGSGIHNLTNFGNNSRIFARNATISDDGKTIVFETNFAGNAQATSIDQIWIVNSDGSGLRQLTFGKDAAVQPSLSADGSTVAFAISGQINVLRVDGRSLKVAVTAFQLSSAHEPAISDDASRIAFTIGPRNGGSGAIYSVKSDGTNLHAVYAPRAVSPKGMFSPVFGFPPSLGSLVTVYGTNLNSDQISSVSALPLPDKLAGVQVLANGRTLPIVSVTPWQVNAQAPQDLPAGTVNLQLAFADGGMTPPMDVDILASAPVPFMYQRQTAAGQLVYFQIAAFHAGTGIAADDEHPAAPGEILEMFGVGLGLTRPEVPGGEPSPANPPARARRNPEVLIGGERAKVLFAGLVPGLAGVYQVNVVVPGGLKSGRQPVVWQTLQFRFAGPGTISVQ